MSIKWITVSPNISYQSFSPFEWWYYTAIQLHKVFLGQHYYAVPGHGNHLHWHILVELKDQLSFNRKKHLLYKMGNIKIKDSNNFDYLIDRYMPKNLEESYPIIGIEDCWITEYTTKQFLDKSFMKYSQVGSPKTKTILDWLCQSPK